MKFTFKPSPNMHSGQTTKSIMMELTIGLMVVFGFSVFYYFKEFGASYGLRAIGLLIVAVVSAVATEWIWFSIRKQKAQKELAISFPWVTAIILTLMVPINMSYYGLAVSTIIAIVFGKLVFGGFGNNIFNPAAVGRAVIMASFAGSVAVDFATGATPTAAMASGGWLMTSQSAFEGFLSSFGGMSNLAVGFYPGALGETSALVIILVGIYLAVRKVIDWRVPVVYIGSLFVFSLMVGLMNNQGIAYPFFHVLTGGALFGAVFMMTDPVTNPTSAAGRIIFAMGCAILTLVIRLKANLPEGVLYSILLMNMLTPAIEQLTDGQQIKMKKKNLISIGVVGVMGIISVGLCGITLTAKEIDVASNDSKEDYPEVNLGTKVALDKDFAKYDAQVEDQGNGLYHVSVKGYGLLEGDSDYGNYDRNEFEVVIQEGLVESVKLVAFGDTKGIGDTMDNPNYTNLFEGLSVDDMSVEVDTITQATWSSESMIAAVQAAMNAAKE